MVWSMVQKVSRDPVLSSSSLNFLSPVRKSPRFGTTTMRTSLLLPLLSIQASAFAKDVPLIRGRHADAAIANRAICNSDNALRALRANSASASPFCSTYIHIPGSTTFQSVAGVTATTCGPLIRVSQIDAAIFSGSTDSLFLQRYVDHHHYRHGGA